MSAEMIVTVLAIRIPGTMCDTTKQHLLSHFFTASGSTIKQTAITIYKGSKNEIENRAQYPPTRVGINRKNKAK